MSRRAVAARTFALALVAAVALASCGKRGDSERFGRDLEMRASIPAHAVKRFNAFAPKPPKPGTSGIDLLLSETETWRSSTPLRVRADSNPYVVAIRVTGQVSGEDGAVTLWLAGYDRLDRHGDSSGAMTKPIAGLNAPKGGANGDGRFERAGASGPVSFREDGDVHPVVEIQRRSGLTIERVDVEVWSGLPNPTWREMLLGWQGALVGVVMLVLWWFGFRRRD